VHKVLNLLNQICVFRRIHNVSLFVTGHGESASREMTTKTTSPPPPPVEGDGVDPAGTTTDIDLPSYIDRVVMEIVETERVYVNDLRQIIQVSVIIKILIKDTSIYIPT